MIITRGLGRDTRVPLPPGGLRIDDIYHANMATRGFGGSETQIVYPPHLHEWEEGWMPDMSIWGSAGKIKKRL
jgi:hypothetical protein